jgi:hypothetical protein
MRYIRCCKTLYIFLYEWIIFPDKMTFFRLSHEVNSKHMFVMVLVRHVETQISLSETNEGVIAQIEFLILENNSKISKILQIENVI